MERTKIFEEVDELISTYCEGCFIKAHFRKEKGKAYAHQFCIKKCTVGDKLKELGHLLK